MDVLEDDPTDPSGDGVGEQLDMRATQAAAWPRTEDRGRRAP